jgi:hypothetical protein
VSQGPDSCSSWAVSHELTEAASPQGFDARGFMIDSSRASDVRSGVLRFTCVGCAAATWALVVVGPPRRRPAPSCEADRSTSWMLLPNGSARASLMSFWARQVRGVLLVRIKPVVAE